MIKHSNQSSNAVGIAMQATFAKHDIPDEVIIGNRPCYSSTLFAQFIKKNGFSACYK